MGNSRQEMFVTLFPWRQVILKQAEYIVGQQVKYIVLNELNLPVSFSQSEWQIFYKVMSIKQELDIYDKLDAGSWS